MIERIVALVPCELCGIERDEDMDTCEICLSQYCSGCESVRIDLCCEDCEDEAELRSDN